MDIVCARDILKTDIKYNKTSSFKVENNIINSPQMSLYLFIVVYSLNSHKNIKIRM